jgi:hypothetical protein
VQNNSHTALARVTIRETSLLTMRRQLGVSHPAPRMGTSWIRFYHPEDAFRQMDITEWSGSMKLLWE